MPFDAPEAGRAGLQWMSPERLDQLHPPLAADMPLGDHWGAGFRQSVVFRPRAGRDQGLLLAHDPLWDESAVLCEGIGFAAAQEAVAAARVNLGYHGVSVDDLALFARGQVRRATVATQAQVGP